MTSTLTPSGSQPGMFETIEQAQEARAVAEAKARRRRLLVWSSPVVAVVGLAALYLLTITVVTAFGGRSYATQAYPTAVRQFSAIQHLNAVETWKAYYNAGTAEYSQGAFFRATQELGEAMERVPRAADGEPRTGEECLVATNLSLAYEGLGDEAARGDDHATAVDYYAQAQATIEGCGSSGGGGGSDEQQESADQAQDRQEQKQNEQQDQQQGEGGEDPSQNPSQDPSADPSASPSQDPSADASASPSENPSGDPSDGGQNPSESPSVSDQQRELEERNRGAQEDRDREQQESGGGSGGGQGW
ncbi:MAG TPA: hypothetical protein DHV14_13275 [Micrococcales bacterium]|uniref:hypothetical protein n=1 Tax=Miniimonas arenae TaxID=676201 RepID=UPI000ED65769|nr:hypothetical protein [Miniimonas arenae]HCX86077.1 hypothetical protein [Micrococcales bacterium]